MRMYSAPDDGYPISKTRDGIDTRNHPEGWNKNALVVEKPLKVWTNSKTGEPMDPPDYARED